MDGELTKLKIDGFKNDKYEGECETFEALINPESFTIKYKTEQNKEQASGTTGTDIKFNKTLPQKLELNLLFDGTGVIQSALSAKNNKTKEDGIAGEIESFKKVVFNYDGENHEPNYLKVYWGVLLFKGRLTNLDIEFKLFKPNGAPIRANVKIEITGTIEEELRIAQENKSSPDLTHIREVQEGDRLPLMTYRIYGDSKYYLEVARVNAISNFRKLQVGQKIFFPPIKK